MKINIDIDCTPEEARTFFGLPDVQPMQKVMMEEVQKRMLEGLQAMTPEAMFKVWLPASIQGWEEIQKAFWTQISGAASSLDSKKEENS